MTDKTVLYDLDSHYEIINGEVIKPEEKSESTGTTTTSIPPEILQYYNEKLLSAPCEKFKSIFSKGNNEL